MIERSTLERKPLILAEELAALRSGELDLGKHLEAVCDLIEGEDPGITAFVPGTFERQRVLGEGAELSRRYPDPENRPPLFGLTLGVKDIFRVDGFATRCGSNLPARLFEGPEAPSVTRLKGAGAVVLGKTVTTEFAGFEPGPTRNPRNPAHTPGGSSSGSAAGVAAGFFGAALGSQTGGSVIRPAAYCGVVGFKPSRGRISLKGVIPFAPSLDHVGFFCGDVSGLPLLSDILLEDWKGLEERPHARDRVLGVPDPAFLSMASLRELGFFRDLLTLLRDSGFTIRECPVLGNIRELRELHSNIMAAEASRVHSRWFAEYRHLYRPRTCHDIEKGLEITDLQLREMLLQKDIETRAILDPMEEEGIDCWLSPGATDSAPEGLQSTGSPVMNMPWTLAGLPVLSIPTAFDDLGLPHALQMAGRPRDDEDLVALGIKVAGLLDEP